MALALLFIGIIFNIFIAALASFNYRDKAARALIFVALGLIYWETTNYFADIDSAFALGWNRLTFLGPLMVMFASYFFIIFLRNQKFSWKALSGLTTGTTLVAVSALTPFIVSAVTPRLIDGETVGFDPVYSVGYGVYISWMIVLIFVFSQKLFASTKFDTRQRKSQIRVLRFGAVIAILLAIITNFALPNLLGSSASAKLVPITSVLYISALSVAIIKHRMLDIKQAAIRSVTYVLSLLTLSIIYYGLAYVVSSTLLRDDVSSDVSVSPVNILLALVLAFIFQPIKNFFDKITDGIFYRNRYDSNNFIAHLSEVLTTTTDLRSLLQRASLSIASTLKSEQAFFFVQYNHIHHLSAGTKQYKGLPVKDAHSLNDYVLSEGGDIIITDLLPETHDIHRLLLSHKIAVLMPLVSSKRIIGYFALGESRSGQYNKRDIQVLSTISDGLVIAIQNALSIQEVKDVNAHLQQRIEFATKELRTTNAQLRQLDTTKDEFLSLASHQLRTPLTSMKGYLSMVLEGDVGKITKSQRHLLAEAFSSSERMVHLIHDFLNVSRLQNGKFMLEKQPIDLQNLVEEELSRLQGVADSRKITLKLENHSTLPLMNIDENKIRQVVMNFIDNAMFYSKEDSLIFVELNEKAGQAEFSVRDSGIGVPSSEQASLFGKFFRASNARKHRPDGTGVGLFLAKKVITAHGGTILFESVEGQGSLFGFRLPVKELVAEVVDGSKKPETVQQSSK